jgi:predicted MFS family arabinose efflux permease
VGWRWAFISLGAASILSGLVIAVLIRDPVRGAAEPELEDVITEEAAARFRFRLVDIKELLRLKTVWVNFIQGCFLLTTINALAIFYVTWLVDDRGFSEADAPMFFGLVVIALAIGNLVGGLAGDWADTRWPRYGRTIASQFSIAVSLPVMIYLLLRATDPISILVASVIVGFFLDWTRRGSKQPMVQNVTRPELRSTAMALTEFVQGAFASVAILAFGGVADRIGLTRTLLILVSGFWTVALLVTSAYYFVYPAEARKLREEMERRRTLIME